MSQENNMTPEEKDKLMDHEYDGIQEFDNNLPGWWKYGFYFTILVGIIYLFVYHIFQSAPLQGEEYKTEMQASYDQTKVLPSFIDAGAAAADEAEANFVLLTDQESIKAGSDIFHSTRNLCYTCHGPEGQGLVGPNLTDGKWIHGCDPKLLARNITTGFPIKGMQPYGSGQRLTSTQLHQVIAYLVSIRGTNPPNPKPIDPTRELDCQ